MPHDPRTLSTGGVNLSGSNTAAPRIWSEGFAESTTKERSDTNRVRRATLTISDASSEKDTKTRFWLENIVIRGCITVP